MGIGKVLVCATALALTFATDPAGAANLTWDANGVGALQTDGAGAWHNPNQWWDGLANQDWADGSEAIFGSGGAGGAVTLGSPTTVNSLTLNTFSGTYTLGTAGQTITVNDGDTTVSKGTLALTGSSTLAGRRGAVDRRRGEGGLGGRGQREGRQQ